MPGKLFPCQKSLFFASVCSILLLTLGSAEAKAESTTFSNPATIAKPFGYTHVVEVSGAHRTLYISGQLGLDLNGKIVGEPGNFKAQADQAFKNLKEALASSGATFKDVVKINMYLTDISSQLPLLREVRDTYVNTERPPASAAVGVNKLALPDALFEIEAIAILPAKP